MMYHIALSLLISLRFRRNRITLFHVFSNSSPVLLFYLRVGRKSLFQSKETLFSYLVRIPKNVRVGLKWQSYTVSTIVFTIDSVTKYLFTFRVFFTQYLWCRYFF
uniref:Uncharacterized protein n=1 Tax=Cacopsylla melanoneura TaxID=428564 RepID=A0A8D9AR10_9HEMI